MARKEPISVQEYTYTAVFEPTPEGGYTAWVPALRGVVTEGETLEEAREMVIDAIEGHLELLRDHGIPIPVDDQPKSVDPIQEPVKVQLKTV